MKKEQSLIIKLLKSLSVKHENMSFTYGYEPLVGHIIEVEPLEMFDNEEYVYNEGNAKVEFYAQYPDKGLTFTDDNSLVRVKNPIFKIEAMSEKATLKRNAFSSKTFWGNLGRTLGF